MKNTTTPDTAVLRAQQQHWDRMLAEHREMFGEAPSDPGRYAATMFQKDKAVHILELGGGQGRDTLFLARCGFQVTVLDYSKSSVEAIKAKAQEMALSDSVTVVQHDVREPLPFANDAFDGCYSHMLYCMALTTTELEALSAEVRRVLKPGGLNIYTVRTTNDAHYGTGIHRGEDMYEVGGFIVHFFNREKIERLAKGFTLAAVDELEEGTLPRKLYQVTLRKETVM